MQQKWDDIDKLIINQVEDIHIEKDYNENLLIRLKNEKVKKNKDQIAAFSFIMTGIFAMILYTSDINYKFIDWEMKTKAQVMSLNESDRIYSIIRLIKGE